jgi:prepilin-type N-terminal cleavage/methylation domain-containing protein
MNKKYRKYSGFTIIEILITLTIILLLFSITYAGVNSLQKRQNIQSAGQNLKNILRDAQNRAYNNEMDCSVCNCGLNTSLSENSWYVNLETQTMYGTCLPVNTAMPTITIWPKEFNLNERIVITPFITPSAPRNTLVFSSGQPMVNTSGLICLKDKDADTPVYIINVDQSGLISDSNGLVAGCTLP